MSRELSRPEVAAVAAGAFVLLTGAWDRPRFNRWLRLSLWTPAALTICAMRRCGGNNNKTLLEHALAPLGRLSPRLGLFAKDVAGVVLVGAALHLVTRLRRLSTAEVKAAVMATVVDVAKCVPPVARQIEKELRKVEADLEKSLKPDGPRPDALVRLPQGGFDAKKLAKKMAAVGKKEDEKWENGGCSGAVYHGERAHLELMNAAAAAYAVANPLHADIWPSVNAMEAEIISMTARLVDGGDAGVVGALSSGGTESIVLATKAARDKMRAERGIIGGAVVACVTAHAAIDKACDLLGLRLVKIPTDADFRCDVAAMRRALTADTVLVYASACSFPQGTIDDVTAISELAFTAGVCCHVDCCLGGFILPFVREAPAFNFGLRGVTSMSVDTHKYGYAPKGSSVVLYRSNAFRRYQYFCYPEWTGGLYVTPTIAGSRSGAVIAATWASLVSMGHDGLAERARKIVSCANVIARGVQQIPHLKLLGAREGESVVDAMVICFASDDLNVYQVNDELVHRGWSLNALQRPASVHLCCTLRTLGHEARFLADLAASVEAVAALGVGAKTEGSAAIYGMASSMPAGPVQDVLQIYTNITLSV